MHISKQYFRNIDALRFVVFPLVFFTHAFVSADPAVKDSRVFRLVSSYAHLGPVALDCFFVMSAFLITWIIFEEEQQTGRFRFGRYLVRRCLRIWPLYFLTVALGYLIVMSVKGAAPLPPARHFFLFTLNFYMAEHGFSFLFFLTILWSIAAEEQFYIVWALCLKYLRKYFSEICFSIILLSVLFRVLNYNDRFQLYFSTFTICADFAVGALVARMAFGRSRFFERLTRVPKGLNALFYVFLILNLVCYKLIYFTYFTVVLERLIFSVLFAYLLIEQNFGRHSLFKAGDSRVLAYLGKPSYGLYIYHGILITFFSKLAARYHWDGNLWMVLLVNPLIILALTIAVALLSYEFVEKKILKLKAKFY
jgi:peptidoglycan/LPS O-acetylase OafA/YrhL